MLNCKPDQLAIKIKAGPHDAIKVGTIVRCIKLFENSVSMNQFNEFVRGDQWHVEFRGESYNPLTGNPWGALDKHLKPLDEDLDGEEDLYAVEKPIKESA